MIGSMSKAGGCGKKSCRAWQGIIVLSGALMLLGCQTNGDGTGTGKGEAGKAEEITLKQSHLRAPLQSLLDQGHASHMIGAFEETKVAEKEDWLLFTSENKLIGAMQSSVFSVPLVMSRDLRGTLASSLVERSITFLQGRRLPRWLYLENLNPVKLRLVPLRSERVTFDRVVGAFLPPDQARAVEANTTGLACAQYQFYTQTGRRPLPAMISDAGVALTLCAEGKTDLDVMAARLFELVDFSEPEEGEESDADRKPSEAILKDKEAADTKAHNLDS